MPSLKKSRADDPFQSVHAVCRAISDRAVSSFQALTTSMVLMVWIVVQAFASWRPTSATRRPLPLPHPIRSFLHLDRARVCAVWHLQLPPRRFSTRLRPLPLRLDLFRAPSDQSPSSCTLNSRSPKVLVRSWRKKKKKSPCLPFGNVSASMPLLRRGLQKKRRSASNDDARRKRSFAATVVPVSHRDRSSSNHDLLASISTLLLGALDPAHRCPPCPTPPPRHQLRRPPHLFRAMLRHASQPSCSLLLSPKSPRSQSRARPTACLTTHTTRPRPHRATKSSEPTGPPCLLPLKA